MNTNPPESNEGDQFSLSVDESGRVTIPREVRERFGVTPGDEIPASFTESVLTIELQPSSTLETVTGDRDDWENTTPTDAGETLFGPMDR